MNVKKTLTSEERDEMLTKAFRYSNMAYLLTETVNSFYVDALGALSHIGISLKNEDKKMFNEMYRSIERARFCSSQLAKHLYNSEDKDDALYDADWFYCLCKLIQDRLGKDERKADILVEFLDAMPSEQIFKIGVEDFKKL